MTTYSETFNYMYAVTDTNGHFKLTSTSPIATDARVTDDDASLDHGDKFSVHGAQATHHHSDPDGKYTFVSLAKDPAGDQGFIAKDSHGHYFFFTDAHIGSGDGSQLSLERGAETICFMSGTRIRTPTRDVAVERLAIGDVVLTAGGQAVTVRWIGRQATSPLFT